MESKKNINQKQNLVDNSQQKQTMLNAAIKNYEVTKNILESQDKNKLTRKKYLPIYTKILAETQTALKNLN